MSGNTDLFAMLATIVGMVFPLWPILVGGALLSRPRHPLWPMLVMWIVMLVCWVGATLVSAPPLMHLIPEPLSTVLFFATGTVIVGLFIFRRLQRPMRRSAR